MGFLCVRTAAIFSIDPCRFDCVYYIVAMDKETDRSSTPTSTRTVRIQIFGGDYFRQTDEDIHFDKEKFSYAARAFYKYVVPHGCQARMTHGILPIRQQVRQVIPVAC